ncbi:MAG: DUF3667 domain-containing protein [Erythrobacter tepidarius]
MNGIGEGIGAAIEGGLLSRAVEPGHGEATGTPHAPVTCANCGATVTGHYCGHCGQKAHIHRSLAAIGHDIMHGVLHLDGKLWNTLPLLVFKPGELTRRFIAGERAKFVSPMAMFLFTVFAMFAVFQIVGISPTDDLAQEIASNKDENAGQSVFRSKVREQIITLKQERDKLPKGDPRRAEIADQLKGLNMVLDAKPTEMNQAEDPPFSVTGLTWLDEGIVTKWEKNPGLMLYKLQSNGYKFSWLLIPLSIPFMWLLFAWRRKFNAYDHAVFVTYSLAFMSLLFIAVSILGAIPGGGDWAALLFLIAAPLHLYKQLKCAYGLTRFSALWRFFLLLFLIVLVLILFLQALLVLGAF